MKISLQVPADNLRTNHGYGVANAGLVASLERLGHEVVYNDPTAPVEIAFSMPPNWQWSSEDAYHIGYTPWESTRIPESWRSFIASADEFWTTSPWCAWMFNREGIRVDNIFQHGVDPFVWLRKRRQWKDGKPLRFLHLGEPAPRKGGQMVFDTFVDTFGDRKDVSLTIKANGHNTIRGSEVINIDENGNVYLDTEAGRPNVKVLTSDMPEHELADLVRRHDVLLYPSWGEGFGLIPLQAMVTGMPVVCPLIWAPYKKWIAPELALPSKIAKSPWPDFHPGNMYEPNAKALAGIMSDLADPWGHGSAFNNIALKSYAASFEIEMAYDWDKLTAEAFAAVTEKFS
jgi:glycosyltransferase involved in cell wall biosynthesis